jgi:hypothetical protein
VSATGVSSPSGSPNAEVLDCPLGDDSADTSETPAPVGPATAAPLVDGAIDDVSEVTGAAPDS